MFNLTGKTALVTGGGGGIGFACACALADQGARIVICDCSEIYAREAAEKLCAQGREAQAVVADISSEADVDALMERIRAFGGVDILVNSAAVTNRKTVQDMTFEEWKKIIDVNLNGAYLIGRAVSAKMIEQGRGGSIIYMVSTGAYRANINFGAYSASKAGVVMLMKTLALELAGYGIRVNAIAPTVTETRFLGDMYKVNPQKRDAAIANHPLGRIALPQDYGGATVYLASDASAFTTGTMLVVDGGKTAK